MKINGRDLHLFIEADDGQLVTVSYATDCTLNVEGEAIARASIEDADWLEYVRGTNTWTIEASGFVNVLDDVSMIDLIQRKTPIDVAFATVAPHADALNAESGQDGRWAIAGKAFLTHYDTKTATTGKAKYSVSLQGSGKLTEERIITI